MIEMFAHGIEFSELSYRVSLLFPCGYPGRGNRYVKEVFVNFSEILSQVMKSLVLLHNYMIHPSFLIEFNHSDKP